MKLLLFDTETTGLPKTRNKAEQGPNNWPHLVSISWILLDSETNKIEKTQSYMIQPQGWVIPADSTKIHGITHDYACDHGVSLYKAIDEFLTQPCDAWVAHNMDFDVGVIVNAVLWDLGIQFPPIRPKRICTMRLGRDICRLPGTYGYKNPKLKELYFRAFGFMPDEASLHSSLYDVRILTEIVQRYLPLRQAMGLVARSDTTTDGVQQSRTLTIRINDPDQNGGSNPSMGK